MKDKYQAYTHNAERITAVYHASLGCWVFMRHRKDGRVSSGFKPAYGFDRQFQKALNLCRSGGYSFKPKASGWKRESVVIKNADKWKEVHEACF
jgi:hypothetical protein